MQNTRPDWPDQSHWNCDDREREKCERVWTFFSIMALVLSIIDSEPSEVEAFIRSRSTLSAFLPLSERPGSRRRSLRSFTLRFSRKPRVNSKGGTGLTLDRSRTSSLDGSSLGSSSWWSVTEASNSDSVACGRVTVSGGASSSVFCLFCFLWEKKK